MSGQNTAKGSRKRKYSGRPNRLRKKQDQKRRTDRNIAIRRARYLKAAKKRLEDAKKEGDPVETSRQQRLVNRMEKVIG